ncbi:hypothetical protein [Streptomyces sp. NPDC019937]|uniref:hypothetical protein n=1 Tax=Streptomyces sp. NPDC019937 TaxID=3154787 RepID=UPI0033CF36C3
MTGPAHEAPGPVGVIVSVDPDRFADVVRAASGAGLTVTGEQPLLGFLTGTIAEDRIPVLEAVDGVEAVDRERIMGIPPPDSPLQ